jgi:hypothetical protein
MDRPLICEFNHARDAQDLGKKELAMAVHARAPFRQATALTESEFDSQWGNYVTSSAALTKPRKQAFVFPSRERAFSFVVTTSEIPTPAWVEPTLSAFIGIQGLPDDWNSYGGKKINRDLISQSLSVLEMIMQATSPPPSVVPLGDGGIQIEWHRKQQDLEMTFPADDRPQYIYRNNADGAEQEGFASDITTLTRLLQSIA